MSGAAAVMAIVLLVFFAAGVAVGVAVVIAASVRRQDRPGRRDRSRGTVPGEWTSPDEADPDFGEPPRWPGDAGHGFGGR